MKRHRQIYQLKNAAKDKLDGKYGGAVLILLLSSLISHAASLLIGSVGSATVHSVFYAFGSDAACHAVSAVFKILLIVAEIICAVMNAGITLYFLNIACGQPFSVRNLFYGFQVDSQKSLAIAAALLLCQVLCLRPFEYLVQNLLTTRDLKWLPWAAAALIIGLCVYLPVALGIALSFYLMLDFPQKSAREILSLCWRMMKGKRCRLLYLELSFLPLIFLCVLSFGIGFLWLEPYMQMTYTCFYLDLMSPGTSSQLT